MVRTTRADRVKSCPLLRDLVVGKVTLPETNSKFAPENRQRAPKGNENSYSNHPFSGANC